MVRCWIFMLACLALSATGCGNSSGLCPVSGEVTLKGQPLASGTVVFEGSNGARGGATITNGKFSLPKAQGLEPGTYTVRLSAVEAPDASSPPGPPGPEVAALERTNRDLIPPEYGVKSTLTFEVGPNSSNKLEVAIP